MTPRVATKRSASGGGTSRSPYGPDSRYSWFADLVAVSAAQWQRDRNIKRPGVADDQPEMYIPAPGGPDGDLGPGQRLEEARSRLQATWHAEERSESWARTLRAQDVAEAAHPLSRHIGERRDLTTTAAGGGDFVPAAGPPIFIAEEFARAARNASMLLNTLRTRPLPETGMNWTCHGSPPVRAWRSRTLSCRLVSETDPTTAVVSSPLSTIAGLVDASRQVYDRALPGLDQVIAAELGAAMGQQIDVAAIQGTGASGQTRGILNVSGTVSVTHTDASPSVGEQVAKAWQAYAVLADTAAGGYGTANPDAYLTIVHPRRYAFLKANQSGQTTFELPGEVVPSASVPTNLGAGTNEDRIIVLDRTQSFIAASAPKFEVLEEPLSGILGIRLRAHCYVAAMFGRQPTSIAIVAGTGLVTPTWPA
jgi:hypothetical protein